MRRRTACRVQNDLLEIDLFERSSQTPEATETDTIENDSSFDPTEPVEMARNDEGNAKKRLNDYARPILQRPVTRIHAPLGRGENFGIDSHVMSMLLIFHDKSSEDPHRHVDDLSQVCEINHLQNVPVDTMKMKLFPATLRDRAKDWFLKLGKEFTSWTEMEEEFLRKYYFVGKTTSVRKAIREFTQGSSETFHEAWERLRDLTRECPHHAVSNHELTQIFYEGLGPQDRYLLDVASSGTFMSKYEDDAMELIKIVAENSHHNAAKPFGRGAMPKAIDAKSAETGMLLERIDKMAEVQNLLLDQLNIRNCSERLAPVSLQEASPCATCSRFDHVKLDCPMMAIQGQGMYGQGPSRGPSQEGRPNYPGNYPNQYNTPVFNNSSQNNEYRRNNNQPYPPQYNGLQSYPNQRQSSFVPLTQPQAYTQASRQTTPASDLILGTISQLMKQMTRMNSRMDEIQDFVKTNVQPTTDKKGKQVTFTDQLPSHATANQRNQGASSTQTHNINHVHIDEEAVETTLAISSLRSGKALSDPYKDHPFHQGQNEEKEMLIMVEQDSDSEDEEEQVTAEPNPKKYKPLVPYSQALNRPKAKNSETDDNLLDAFKMVTITIPLIDVIKYIPSYAKFLKGICTPYRNL